MTPHTFPSKLKAALLCMLVMGCSFSGSRLFAQSQTARPVNILTTSDGDEDGDRLDGALCGGTERWGQKVLIDTATRSINWTPDTITVSGFDTLHTYPPNSYAPRTAPLEFQAYTINCHIIEQRAETDADFHLIMYDGATTGIAEIPDPVCAAAATSKWVNNFIEARNFATKYIGAGTNYNVNIGRVYITGVAFVDPPHGQSGVAPNNLELHPVTNLVFVNPADGIDEKSQYVNVTVGPNPFNISTEFQINSKLNNLHKITLSLFDILGEEVQTIAVPTIGNSQVDYILEKNSLLPGTYIYRFRNDGNILYEGRLVVQ
jgi:hypothetical protein